MAKAIGPNFANELAAYGIAHSIQIIGAHIAWFGDGTLEFFDDTPSGVQTAVEAVYAAHDPTVPDPNAAATVMFAAGVTVNSTGTPAINGVYGTTLQDEINYTGLQVAVANGVFPGWIRDKAGAKHTMTGSQCTAVVTAILGFIVAVDEAKAAALAGGSWVAPSATVTIA
jgi:hypothetical protein